jgi:hypothetical protein
MAGFGSQNPFPRRFGGGLRPRTYEKRALARTFQRDGYDVSEGTARAAEAYAYSNAIGSIWAVNARLSHAEVPLKMIETLPTWEEILRTRPSADDSDNARRAAVAAKLRGISGQATFDDIEDVCRALLGTAFEGLAKVEPSDIVSFWPGVNPGPPGFEWTSNRMALGIKVRQGSRARAEWDRLIQQLQDLLQTLLPSWEVFHVGTSDGGFFPGAGLPGVTLLG